MDNNIRNLERKAAMGDPEAGAKLAAARTRAGRGRVATLRRYIGRKVYIEGARMNYLGVLSEVTVASDGGPAELLFSALSRVGDWRREGPNPTYTLELPASEEHPQWIPWAAVDNFGLSPWK